MSVSRYSPGKAARPLIRAVTGLLALCLAMPERLVAEPAPAAPPPSQTQSPAETQTPAQAPDAQKAPVFRTEEIDQMTAPIALYPDELVAQILMAATYPLELVMAERWVSDPAHAKLSGDELAAAIEKETWDPSVKSLVPYPPVLKMMSDKLDWTQRLGDAFLAQQADVMSSIQRLRRQAQDSGTLKTTEQQTVVTQKETTTEKETIIIQPTNPQVVYVPTYNPTVAYGAWPYPAYPPVYYPPPAAYYPVGTALVSGMAFATGVAVVGSLSGWSNCNWGHGDVNINTNRYNTINSSNIRAGRATQLQANASTWRHNPAHRGGVAYRDPATRQAYNRQAAGAGAASRNVRGYDGTQPRAGQQGAARGSAGNAARSQAPRSGTSAGPAQRDTATARRPNTTAGAGTSRAPAAQRQQPQAFQGISDGSAVRAQSQRGQASRQSMGSAPRAGGVGGGARAGGGGGRR